MTILKDDRLYSLLKKGNDFHEDVENFENSVNKAFSDDKRLAEYIVELHAVGIVEAIEAASELSQSLMDDMIKYLSDRDGVDKLNNEETARKAVKMWFEAYGEEILGLLCSVEGEEKEESENGSISYGDQNDILLEDIELSARSYNCLKRAGIRTLREIAEKTPADLMKIHNLGRRALEEILAKLKEYDLKPAESEEEYRVEEDTDEASTSKNTTDYKKLGLGKVGKEIKEWLIEKDFELPFTLCKQEDADTEYVLQTIKDNSVYAEIIQGGKTTDYCRFNIESKEFFVIKED